MSSRFAEIQNEKFFKFVFQNANDAQYLLDYDKQVFIDVNSAFEKLTGYSRREVLNGKLMAKDLIAQEDINVYQQKKKRRDKTPAEKYEIRIITKDRRKIPVEVSVRKVKVAGKKLIIGALRDISQRKELEQELFNRMRTIVQTNTGIFALTEQLQNLSHAAVGMLEVETEQEIFPIISKKMTTPWSEGGLGYQKVKFYIYSEGALKSVPDNPSLRSVPLTNSHKYMQIFNGNIAKIVTKHKSIVLIKAKEKPIGIMELFFDKKTINLLRASPRAYKAYTEDIPAILATSMGFIIEIFRLKEDLRMQSLLDPLTSVYNRRHLDFCLQNEIQRAIRYQKPLSVILFDLDNFKPINDTYGHKQGDMVLIELASIFRRHLRKTDVICRYGGDEFLIIMTETSLENTYKKAEALRKMIKDYEFTNLTDLEHPLKLTISAGVISFNSSISDADELLKRADNALYTAKNTGKDKVCLG